VPIFDMSILYFPSYIINFFSLHQTYINTPKPYPIIIHAGRAASAAYDI
jgi:hypothetical protein